MIYSERVRESVRKGTGGLSLRDEQTRVRQGGRLSADLEVRIPDGILLNL